MELIKKVASVLMAAIIIGIVVGIGLIALGFVIRGVYSVWGFMF